MSNREKSNRDISGYEKIILEEKFCYFMVNLFRPVHSVPDPTVSPGRITSTGQIDGDCWPEIRPSAREYATTFTWVTRREGEAIEDPYVEKVEVTTDGRIRGELGFHYELETENEVRCREEARAAR